jgi:hypothetical protein
LSLTADFFNTRNVCWEPAVDPFSIKAVINQAINPTHYPLAPGQAAAAIDTSNGRTPSNKLGKVAEPVTYTSEFTEDYLEKPQFDDYFQLVPKEILAPMQHPHGTPHG